MMTKSKMLLSIIVPVYNAECYLPQCIESILNQSFQDFELILVNDGSTDNSLYICQEYCKLDNRIVLLNQSNGGQNNARKNGLSVANGRYVGFVDSDDWIDPEMYDNMLGIALKFDSDMIICNFSINYPDDYELKQQFISPGHYNKLALQNSVYPYLLYSGKFFNFGLFPAFWNKIIKIEILRKYLNNINLSLKFGEDVACIFPMIYEIEKLYIMEGSFYYHYRVNQKSITTSYIREYSNHLLLLTDILEEKLSEINCPNIEIQLNYYFVSLIFSYIQNELKIDNVKSKNEIIQSVKTFISMKNFKNALKKTSIKPMTIKDKIYVLLLKFDYLKILFLLIEINRKLKFLLENIVNNFSKLSIKR